MITFIRTDATNIDFAHLVHCLDAELAQRDGSDHAFYAQFNNIDGIRHALVARIGPDPVGCGAIKPFADDAMEVKRMYVLPEYRGRGIATGILKELENWATELGYCRCILETGKRQPEAIQLYAKCGYRRIPNFGQYIGDENSVCFMKEMAVTTDDHSA